MNNERVVDEKRLEELRIRIDSLDVELVRILNERSSHALEIGNLKDALGLEAIQLGREHEVLDRVRSVNSGPLDSGAVTRLFKEIIEETRRIEYLSLKKEEPKKSEKP